MAAVPQEQQVDVSVFRVLNQPLRRMADPFFCSDLNTMIHTLGGCLCAELFEQRVGALPFFIGFAGDARIPRQLLNEDNR